MKLTSIGLGIALCLCASSAQAATPEQTVRECVEKVQALIERNHAEYAADSAKYYAMVDEVMLPYFDLQRIGRLTLGSHWQSATASQRQRLTATFKTTMVRGYADAVLAEHGSMSMEWADPGDTPDTGDSTVNATLKRKDGQPISLGFSMDTLNGQWKIYDLALDGISLAAGLRAQFKSEIARNGLDGLIQRLESRAKSE